MKSDHADVRILWLSAMLILAARSPLSAGGSQGQFDAGPILQHNRAWLHPDLGRLKSVSFKHVMEPIRYDERFVWRRDGASLVELLDAQDNADRVGQRWVTAPPAQSWYFAPHSRYAQANPPPGEGLDRYVRRHLMGTRTNFIALDWGWDPAGFAVRKVRSQPDGLIVAQVAPLHAGYRMNAGAMFHATSWAYVHDIDVVWAELSVDPATRRVVREVDYAPNGMVECEIEFADWNPAGDGGEVPLRVHLRFARHDRFDVDYRFQWRDEGLWILKVSTARFEGKAPQCEEIRDLAINRPTPVLDDVLAQIERGRKELHAPGVQSAQVTLAGVYRFDLGKQAVLLKPDPVDGPPVQSVHFTLQPRERFFEMGGTPDLVAEIGLTKPAEGLSPEDQLLLTLLDASGRPLEAVRAPLAALSASQRRFDDVVRIVRDHNSLWLAPGAAQFPNLTYEFVSGQRGRVTVSQKSDSYLRRGVTLWLDWDGFLTRPQQYKAPVKFDAVLDGKPVVVAAVSGPPFGLRWGGGLEGVVGYYGGYSVTTASHGLVVIEKDTWRPLVSRYGDNEIHFLDYVEVRPGLDVPLRIVVLRGETRYDFHFQVIDGRVWLFDRFCREGKVLARTESLAFADGTPAKVTARLPEDVPPVEKLKPLDWGRISHRASVHKPELPLVRAIIVRERPWEHPGFDALLKSALVAGKNAEGPLLSVNFGWSWLWADVRHWTLTWLSPGRPPRSLAGPEGLTVPAYPFRPGEPMAVQVPSGKVGTWEGGGASIRRLELKPEAGSVRAIVEIVSAAENRGLWLPVSVALVKEDGVIVSAASAEANMTVHQGIVSREQALVLPLDESRPKHVLLGIKSAVTSRPIGSVWGSYGHTDPLFALEQLFAADDPRVWRYGVTVLDTEVRAALNRSFFFWGNNAAEKDQAAETLKPHAGSLARLLKTSDQPEALAALARLAGYSADARFHDALARLLGHAQPAVQDAAAIGLGLLGDAQGIERLRLVLSRPLPDDHGDARWEAEQWQIDAAMALSRIGTTQAVRILGDALLEKLGQVHVQPNEHGETLVGPTRLVEIVIQLLGRTSDPLVLEYYLRASGSGKIGARYDNLIAPYLAKRLDKEPVCMALFEGIRRGQAEFIAAAPNEPAFVDAIIQASFKADLNPWAMRTAVRWLGRSGDAKAIGALRRAFDEKRFADNADVRQELITVLAEHGDYRGMAELFDRLAKALDESTLPADAQARNRESRKRQVTVNELARVTIPGRFPPAFVAEFLRPRMTSASDP